MSKKQALKISSGWQEIYTTLKELYISTFKWENLPEEINTRYLENCLFEMGSATFFNDEMLSQYLTLPWTQEGGFDVYGDPVNIRAYGTNGYTRRLTNHKNTVIIYNNMSRSGAKTRIEDYAKRIYNIERTIDINVYAQRTPYIFKCNKKTELTIRNLARNVDEYSFATFVDDMVNLDGTMVIPIIAPFVSDKLEEEKRKLWNEALSFIGIENNFSEKNERLVSNEVLISNGLSQACKNSRLMAREQAAEEINRLFGLKIEVAPNNQSVIDMVTEQKLYGIGESEEL